MYKRNETYKIGIKSGCWTLLHAGHIWCIQECIKQCDYLIVLTNSDEYISRKKGGVAPVCLEDRLYLLKHIKGVNEVNWFSEDTEDQWIRKYKEKFLRDYPKIELIVFHSDELKDQSWVPGMDYADEIIFIDKINRKESVTKMYNQIQGKGK